MRQPPATARRVKPRSCSVYSASRACRCSRTSSTGSSSAEASASSVTGSSTSTVGSTSGSASGATSTASAGTVTASSLIVCSCVGLGCRGRRLGALGGLGGLVGLVELVGDLHVAVVGAGPADVELAEGLGLLEGDGRLLEQLEQREEPGHDDERAVGVGDEAAEGHLTA